MSDAHTQQTGMTANRWWVRLFARWKAKIGAVQADINMFFTAVQTVTIASGIMAFFSVPSWFIVFLMAAMFASVAVYAHLYSEGGVWNHTQRVTRDLSDNFAKPSQRMGNEMNGVAFFAAKEGRMPTEEEREAISQAVDEVWNDYRDGVDVNESH